MKEIKNMSFDEKLDTLESNILKSLDELGFDSYTGAPNKLLASFLKDQVLVYSKFLSDLRKEVTTEEENVIEVDSHQTPIV